MTKNTFVHVELSSSDDPAMKEFYGRSFDWTFMDFPDMNYTTFGTGEGNLGGGFSRISKDSPAGTVLLYIHTDNLEETKAKIKEAGGEILMESQKIPTVGEMAIFRDPAGNNLALLQPEGDM